jgi:hypothetical protein
MALRFGHKDVEEQAMEDPGVDGMASWLLLNRVIEHGLEGGRRFEPSRY